MMALLLRFLLLSTLLLFLYACGMRFTYNNLDTIIPWYLDDYVELSDQQQALFEKQLAQQLNWHRGTQLPVYAQALRQIDQQLVKNFQRDRLYQHRDQLKQYWQVLVQQIIPDLTVLLAQSSDEQVQEFFTVLEERNLKFKERSVDVTEREWREKRADRMRKNLKRWLGEVSTQQQRIIDDWSERLQRTSTLTLQYRQQWQQNLRQLLNNRQNIKNFSAELENLLINPEQNQSPELRQAYDYNTELFFDLLTELNKDLSSAQRLFLSNKILSLAEDFETLARAD